MTPKTNSAFQDNGYTYYIYNEYTDRLTEKNYRETLANWHDFVVNYDYDKFWDDYYWYQFHTPAGAKT